METINHSNLQITVEIIRNILNFDFKNPPSLFALNNETCRSNIGSNFRIAELFKKYGRCSMYSFWALGWFPNKSQEGFIRTESRPITRRNIDRNQRRSIKLVLHKSTSPHKIFYFKSLFGNTLQTTLLILCIYFSLRMPISSEIIPRTDTIIGIDYVRILWRTRIQINTHPVFW